MLVVAFELDGFPFSALNGGPLFKFTEAISFEVRCESQKEIDEYWDKLGAGGDPRAQQCGWLKDRFGLSWQVVPNGMDDMLKDAESPRAARVMKAFLAMKKVDIEDAGTSVGWRLSAAVLANSGDKPRVPVRKTEKTVRNHRFTVVQLSVIKGRHDVRWTGDGSSTDGRQPTPDSARQ